MKRSNERPDPLTPAAKAPIRRVEHLLKHLQRLGLFYGWGGGRQTGIMVGPKHKAEAWTDCSGLGLYIARVVGVELQFPVGNTTTMLEDSKLRQGRGHWLSFLVKEIAGHPEQSHMLVELRGRHAECGGWDNPSPRGGPHFFKPSAARLSEFPHHLHIPGL
jgi:hypothetical protein